MAITSSTAPNMSSRCSRDRLDSFLSGWLITSIAIAPSGRLSQKISDQSYSASVPPSSGPPMPATAHMPEIHAA